MKVEWKNVFWASTSYDSSIFCNYFPEKAGVRIKPHKSFRIVKI